MTETPDLPPSSAGSPQPRPEFQQAMRATTTIAQTTAGAEGEDERLKVAVATVMECVRGCDHAGVMLIHRHRIETRAPTSQLVVAGDLLQYELQEGPCLDTVLQQTSAVSNRIVDDPRWPRWGPAVEQQLGVQAMLSLLLFTNETSYGALNLYAETPDAFDRDDIVVAQALSTHLAIALAAGRELDHRATALVNRTVIGQAEGILMERHRIDAQEAFRLLRKASQDLNRRLAVIAEELVRTGELPSRDT